MLDFTEQEVSVTSPPELSADTPTVSDNLPDTEPRLKSVGDWQKLAEEGTTAATQAALAPWLTYIQDETEPQPV